MARHVEGASLSVDKPQPPTADYGAVTPRPGGYPKALELFSTCDVADASVYGIGLSNNG